MTLYEIGIVFQAADTSRTGKVDKSEWLDFYNNFVSAFEFADIDKDGLLSETEL